jgi:hypothetical protein
MRILLGYAKAGMEDVFKMTLASESFHKINNDTLIRILKVE